MQEKASYFASAGASWKQLARFSIVVCLPLFLICILLIWFADADVARDLKPRFGNPLHLWARATTDVARAEPYFGLTIGLAILFSALLRFSPQERFRRWRGWAVFGLLSLVSGGMLSQFLKHLIGRKRPYADAMLTSHEFSPFTANYEFHSLPSGHSQVLFSVATILCILVPRVWWLWLSVAAVFATTRVITLNHWASDIVAGAAVGMFGTVLTFRLMMQRRKAMSFIPTAILSFAFAVSVLAPSSSHADSPGPLGLGLVIGDPTGLSMNYRLSGDRSIDGALAWNFGRWSGFEMHSDYLWHRDNFLKGKFAFDLHYGIGARLISIDDRTQNDRTFFGPRLPVGLSTNFNQAALEVFGELALVMNLIPGTSADFDFGIGARIYF